MSDWRPTASHQVLRQRAAIVVAIRDFFAARELVEVELPCLGRYGVTDVHIDSISASYNADLGYLQSSPEQFFKQLLADGFGSAFYLGKAFRDGELGARHNPEFTMLEWYRVGWDEHQLAEEVLSLIRHVATVCSDNKVLGGDNPQVRSQSIAYGELFHQHVGIDPHGCELEALQQAATEKAGTCCDKESRSTCLDLLFSVQVEPNLPSGLTVVTDYPVCQAALATRKKDAHGNEVARRFEVFWDGLELANGYFELTDEVEQRSRFDADIALRDSLGKPAMAVNTPFMDAMKGGLPVCSGVALGVDRLVMRLLGLEQVQQTMAFGSRG